MMLHRVLGGRQMRLGSWIGRVHVLASTLSVRLFFWLFSLLLLVVSVYAYINIRSTSESWMAFVYESANRASELIKRSTHYGMLQNRKEDVHQIIRTVAQTSGVAGVRIFDKQGMVIFSADPAEIGRRVDLQAEACIICHDRATPLSSAPTASRVRVYRSGSGERILGLINPIENRPECSNGGCHAHRPEQTVLGVLDVKMSLSAADAALSDMTRRMIVSTLVKALVIAIASALFLDRMVRRPVRRLIDGTERIARGELGTSLELHTRDEIGQLAAAFDRMSADLRRAQDEIREWSQKLEQKVVAKTDELTRAQKQILHMEKMASLGKLSATVAHELNNPLSGILTYAKLVARELERGHFTPADVEELGRYLVLIQKESSRCGDIVRNLLLFAHRSGAELAEQRLGPILERSLMIVRHHLEISGIVLEISSLPEDDALVCDGNQIQQALIALFVNAVEAMPEGGVLRVRIEASDGVLHLDVEDSGAGIPPAVLPHIFEPFFSTKQSECGVGLGLAVVYGIVQRHGGSIEVASTPAEGTTFHLTLPRCPPAAVAALADGVRDARDPDRGVHHAI